MRDLGSGESGEGIAWSLGGGRGWRECCVNLGAEVLFLGGWGMRMFRELGGRGVEGAL